MAIDELRSPQKQATNHIDEGDNDELVEISESSASSQARGRWNEVKPTVIIIDDDDTELLIKQGEPSKTAATFQIPSGPVKKPVNVERVMAAQKALLRRIYPESKTFSGQSSMFGEKAQPESKDDDPANSEGRYPKDVHLIEDGPQIDAAAKRVSNKESSWMQAELPVADKEHEKLKSAYDALQKRCAGRKPSTKMKLELSKLRKMLLVSDLVKGGRGASPAAAAKVPRQRSRVSELGNSLFVADGARRGDDHHAQDNGYGIWEESGSGAEVIDPGDEALSQSLQEELYGRGFRGDGEDTAKIGTGMQSETTHR